MSMIFDRNAQYEFELLRTMGQTAYGGAVIGECLATARRVTEGDNDSWHREWTATADWVYARGEAALAGAHPVTPTRRRRGRGRSR